MSKEKLKDPYSVYLIAWIWGILGGVIVFFGLLYLSGHNFLTIVHQLSFQIDPTNIFTIGITAYLAIKIIPQLQRGDENDKIERGLFISCLSEFHTKFTNDIHVLMVTTGVDGKSVASILKSLDMSLQETIELSKLNPCENDNNFELLNQQFSNVRELLSCVPEKDDKTKNVVIKESKMFYSVDYLNSISKEMANLKKTIFSIIMRINRN
jgi:hypothetical protein